MLSVSGSRARACGGGGTACWPLPTRSATVNRRGIPHNGQQHAMRASAALTAVPGRQALHPCVAQCHNFSHNGMDDRPPLPMVSRTWMIMLSALFTLNLTLARE